MAFPTVLQKANRHAPIIACVLVIVLSGLYVAAQIRDWLRMVRTPPAYTAQPSQPVSTSLDLERIARIFGTPATQAQLPVASRSSLSLHGSFVHPDPSRSTAIIQIDVQPPRLYRVGEQLQQGLILQRVYPDSIEIMRDGNVENLSFPEIRAAQPASGNDAVEQQTSQQSDLPGEVSEPPAAEAPADQPTTEDE